MRQKLIKSFLCTKQTANANHWPQGKSHGNGDLNMVILHFLFLISLFLHNTLLASNITMSFRNVEQSDPNQLNVSVPAQQQFMVQVDIKNCPQNINPPEIPGLEKFQVPSTRQSFSHTVYNGKMSLQCMFMYTLQATQPGSYDLGPISFTHNGTVEKTPQAHITVTNAIPQQQQGHMQNEQAGNKQSKNNPVIICKLVSDKSEVLLGEQFHVRCIIHLRRDVIEGRTGQLQCPGFTIKELKQDKQSESTIDGTTYLTIEKSYLLTPIQTGVKTIQPMSVMAAVATRKKHGGSMFDDGFLESFFGPQAQQVEATSNALDITVKTLPASINADGVGRFTRFDAVLSATEAMASQPVTLTITLEGAADLDHIPALQLKMPDGLKYYDSKTETVPSPETPGTGKRLFEYIIQPTRTGTLTIPEQTFRGFDTATQKVVVLKTTPLVLNVTGQASGTIATQQASPTNQETLPPVAPSEQLKDDVHFIHEDTNQQPPLALPWWLFSFMLIVLPVAIVMALNPALRTRLLRGKASAPRWEQELGLLEKNLNVQALHQFFIALFSAKLQTAPADITESVVAQKLGQRGWDADKISDLLDFLAVCAQYHFSKTKPDAHTAQALLKKAHYWLVLING
jgi:hypothetical protein